MEQHAVKKICIYCERWTKGGIETFVAETLSHMDRSGLEFHLAVAEWEDVFRDQLDAAGVKVHVLQPRHGTGACWRTLSSLAPFRTLLQREQFDVVHLNLFHGAAFSLALFARLEGVHAVIVHSHGAGIRKSPGCWFKRAVHWMCTLVFAFVPTDRWAASASAGRFLFPTVRKVQLIPNGIDSRRFRFSEDSRRQVRRKLRIEPFYVIACVGRLEPQKNQAFLLEALRECVRVHPQTALLLVGDGDSRQALEQQAAQYNLQENVRFTGQSDHVPELLWAADALAVPSVSEGLGIVVIEGQAAGLPVLCSTGVPQEAQLTDAVEFLPLRVGAATWAQRLLTLPPQDRLRQNDRIQNSQFCIDASAEIVREGYLQAASRRDGRGRSLR